ncbi:MAG: ROK family protein, partial [Firmicutes bacterium HGW-Firmicutes-19]
PMEATMRKRVSIMPVEQVQIVPAALGEQAGVIGSALWAKTIVESS